MSDGLITMRQFGHMGRFGNQLFQYAYLKLLSERLDCSLQLPPWVGNELFGADEPPVRCNLEPYKEHVANDGWLQGIPAPDDALVNRDFVGYAQYHTSHFAPHRERFRELFQPTQAVRDRIGSTLLDDTNETWVGIHLRRGDYGRLIFYITPVAWYLKTLGELWRTLRNPRLFIATEDPTLVSQFANYDPVTAEDLGVELHPEPMANYPYLHRDLAEREPWQLDFYPDFYLLSKCRVILAPNSTFSFAAAMLGDDPAFYRSHLPTQTFRREDPWNAYPLQRDDVKDYPTVEGVALEHNPYW